MSLPLIRGWALRGLLALSWLGALGTALRPLPASAQQEPSRKVRTKVAPTYPEVARRMNISGTVRLAVVVAANGTLKDTKVLGGHPVLVNAAMDAVKKWKFESAPQESTETLEFKFAAPN